MIDFIIIILMMMSTDTLWSQNDNDDDDSDNNESKNDSAIECEDSFMRINATEGQNYTRVCSLVNDNYDRICDFLRHHVFDTHGSADMLVTVHVDVKDYDSLLLSQQTFTGPKYNYTMDSVDNILVNNCVYYLDDFIETYFEDRAMTVRITSIIVLCVNII